MSYAVAVTADQAITILEFPKGNDDDPKQVDVMQAAVNGLFERVPVLLPERADLCDMWVNEEGAITGLPLNMTATVVANLTRTSFIPIYGDVLFTDAVDVDGWSMGFTADYVEVVAANLEWLAHAAAAVARGVLN